MNCPECDTFISDNAKNCIYCGWKENKSASNKPFPDSDLICQWSMNKKVCPYLSLYEHEGKWMCMFHPQGGEQIWDWTNEILGGYANEVRKLYVKTIHDNAYWKDKTTWLVNWDGVHRDRENAPQWYKEASKKLSVIVRRKIDKMYEIEYARWKDTKPVTAMERILEKIKI